MAGADFIGIGLYTVAEASRLTGISAPKLVRWLSGYARGGQEYPALWEPQIDIGDGRVYLSFRDMMEARVANKFVAMGVPPLHIRAGIINARAILGVERPLSTNRFLSDGRAILLEIIEKDAEGQERKHLVNLFKNQYEFAAIIEPLLKDVDFDAFGSPSSWWPKGHARQILVDPARSFGQPIDAASSVPVAILANAGRLHGLAAAAKSFEVPRPSVRRAMEFFNMKELRRAA